MKRFLITLVLVAIIVVTIICVFMENDKDKTKWIENNRFLYDKAVAYLVKEAENEIAKENDKKNYKIFTDYKGFGIEEKDKKKYVYLWIIEERYYEENGDAQLDSGSSMFYKFTFENNKVVKYEIPKDGSEYTESLQEMLPKSIISEVSNFSVNNQLDLSQQVEKWKASLKTKK